MDPALRLHTQLIKAGPKILEGDDLLTQGSEQDLEAQHPGPHAFIIDLPMPAWNIFEYVLVAKVDPQHSEMPARFFVKELTSLIELILESNPESIICKVEGHGYDKLTFRGPCVEHAHLSFGIALNVVPQS